MVRAAWVVLLLLLGLVGCYSPAYRDCEVRCGGGDCPSGLTCDEALGVCRLAGASGACPSGGDDDAGVDSGDDGGLMLEFCSEVEHKAVLCHDFDNEVAVPELGWDLKNVTGAGTLSLVTSPRSLPYALQTSLNMGSDMTEADYAVLRQSFPIADNFSEVRLALDLRFDAFPAPSQFKELVNLNASSEFSFSLQAIADGTLRAIINGDPNLDYEHVLIMSKAWVRVEVVLKRDVGTKLLAVSAFVDGMPLETASGYLTAVEIPDSLPPWTLTVGVSGIADAEITMEYDNIIVLAEP